MHKHITHRIGQIAPQTVADSLNWPRLLARLENTTKPRFDNAMSWIETNFKTLELGGNMAWFYALKELIAHMESRASDKITKRFSEHLARELQRG